MTTTQNTDETFDFMNAWEEDTVRDAMIEFAEYDVDEADSSYKEMRNKRKDEWRDSKRMKQTERKQARDFKRNWEN